MAKTILITGSCGLIGSSTAIWFLDRGYRVVGIDNNLREEFFGKAGRTLHVNKYLTETYKNYIHVDGDIRSESLVDEIVIETDLAGIVHAAGQPSHDKAASIPITDFKVNAYGTLVLLEAVRKYSANTPFVFLSTNKVYGDRPNRLALTEYDTRYDFSGEIHSAGINESLSVDQCLHSIFGVSKLSADLLVQEYGRYFNLNTCCLRGGCLTGPLQAGVQLHGFLNYLVRCSLERKEYTIFGHKGKQVRDNIHAKDVASFISEFFKSPRIGEVYNIGGGYTNSSSILESLKMVEQASGVPARYTYVDQPRVGDHIVYYTDLSKIHSHYPGWKISMSLEEIIQDLVAGVNCP